MPRRDPCPLESRTLRRAGASSLAGLLLLLLLLPGGLRGAEAAERRLAEAPRAEAESLERFRAGPAWAHRAIAALRLDRYDCPESAALLQAMLRDRAWQVRAFAIRGLARRGAEPMPEALAAETEPRVIRAALRYGWRLDAERVRRGVAALDAAPDFASRLLGVEIAASANDPSLLDAAQETLSTIIYRMDPAEGGAFSPRIARLVGDADLRSAHRWRRWRLKQGPDLVLRDLRIADPRELPPTALATLEPERFAALEDYMQQLRTRRVDLAICLDCTASMGGELRAAQGGLDDLALFVGDVVAELRVGLVAYRDRRDREFETRHWDFTADRTEARRRLFSLSADGGGDRPESVYAAIACALESLSWDPTHAMTLVLIGDAPPHPGHGGPCADLVRAAREKGLVTHAIEAEGEPVEHFAGIAEAGGGRCVALDDDEGLVAEIAGLTLGATYAAEFRAFFALYLDLCR